MYNIDFVVVITIIIIIITIIIIIIIINIIIIIIIIIIIVIIQLSVVVVLMYDNHQDRLDLNQAYYKTIKIYRHVIKPYNFNSRQWNWEST